MLIKKPTNITGEPTLQHFRLHMVTLVVNLRAFANLRSQTPGRARMTRALNVGYPFHHPAMFTGCSMKNHPAIGDLPFSETPFFVFFRYHDPPTHRAYQRCPWGRCRNHFWATWERNETSS